MQKYANLVELEKCCQTHILNYFLAKFRFDTAENEPAKNLQILQDAFSKNAFSKNAFCSRQAAPAPRGREVEGLVRLLDGDALVARLPLPGVVGLPDRPCHLPA